MMEDIVGDYKDKTVTLETFPFSSSNSAKMATVHPCKHAAVMKLMLDRADAALKMRRDRLKAGDASASAKMGMEGLVDDINKLNVGGGDAGVSTNSSSAAAAASSSEPAESKGSGEEWEEVSHETADEVAIRVDQYLVVFLKAS